LAPSGIKKKKSLREAVSETEKPGWGLDSSGRRGRATAGWANAEIARGGGVVLRQNWTAGGEGGDEPFVERGKAVGSEKRDEERGALGQCTL